MRNWNYQKNTAHKLISSGFTLVELTVVIIILGLVLGSVFLLQTLIKSSQIRGVIAQKAGFDTAVESFKIKYEDYMPGDLPPAIAAANGLFTATAGTTFGNQQIDFSAYGEDLVFWRHLSEAGMIIGAYGDPANPIVPSTGRTTSNTTNVAAFLPAGKIDGTYFFARYLSWYIDNGTLVYKNYYVFHGYNFISSGGGTGTSYMITPQEAYGIDVKMDDGKPNTGKVIGNMNWGSTAGIGACTYGSTHLYRAAVQYNTDTATGGTQKACQMYFEF